MAGTDTHNGWMAQIVRANSDEGECEAITERADADRIAASVGMTIEEDVDAANGLWMVTVTTAQVETLYADGWLDATSAEGSVLIDAGDAISPTEEADHEW